MHNSNIYYHILSLEQQNFVISSPNNYEEFQLNSPCFTKTGVKSRKSEKEHQGSISTERGEETIDEETQMGHKNVDYEAQKEVVDSPMSTTKIAEAETLDQLTERVDSTKKRDWLTLTLTQFGEKLRTAIERLKETFSAALSFRLQTITEAAREHRILGSANPEKRGSNGLSNSSG